MIPLIVVAVTVFGFVVFLGHVAARAFFCGGWANRHTHSCGWFECYGYQVPPPGDPCPGCGKADYEWRWRNGRPLYPFGWEWRD